MLKVLEVVVYYESLLLQDCHTLRSLRLQEVGFARLLSLVVWLLLLLIMVPNMALPIKEVKVQQLSGLENCRLDVITSLYLHSVNHVSY